MDVFSLLHEDHENVSLIFKKIESMRSKETEQTREQLFKELYTELTLHAEVEEDVVYPFFEEKQETASIVEESLHEHEEIESVIASKPSFRPRSSAPRAPSASNHRTACFSRAIGIDRYRKSIRAPDRST